MGSGGGKWDAGDIVTQDRANQKMLIVDTGANVEALATTYAGQLVSPTSDGTTLKAERLYRRNSANTNWQTIALALTEGDTVFMSADTEKNNGSPDAYTKSKEILVGVPGGNIRVKFDLAESASVTGNVKAQIYKNGVAFGTERTAAAVYGSFTTFTEDLEFDAGDTCELWIKAPSTSHNVYTRNFRLCVEYPPYGSVTLDS